VFLKQKKISGKSDGELLKKYATTLDQIHLAELYDRYIHLVYGVCLKYLEDREKAKDAVMQIYEKLIETVPKHSIENFRPWLYVLSKNYCRMQLRRKEAIAFSKINSEESEHIFMELDTVVHPNDEGGVSLDQDIEHIRTCIEQLKDEQKQCVKLFFLEEKPYKEVSEALAMEMKKVKSYIQNGKRNLKICVEKMIREQR